MANLSTILKRDTAGRVATDGIADGAVNNAKIATTAAIAPSKLAAVTAGQVLLGNATGVITATSITGDVTISSTGVATISASAVGAAEIADGAIGVAELATGAVTGAAGGGKLAASAISGQTLITSAATTDQLLIWDATDSLLKRITVGVLSTGTSPVKAWLNIKQTGTLTIRNSFNVSSVTAIAGLPGRYTVNFATAMPHANYAFVFGGHGGPATNWAYATGAHVTTSGAYQPTTTSIQIQGADGNNDPCALEAFTMAIIC